MEDTILKIAVAGLIHDIGKFADKAVIDIKDEYIQANADIFLPKVDGGYSDYHALYTAAFIETKKDILPEHFYCKEWGQEDALIKLAASHHNPQTIMQWIIAVADRVSNGCEQDNTESSPKDYKKSRLVPLFEQLNLKSAKVSDSKNDSFSYVYPIRHISPDSIFPKLKKNASPADIEREYKELFKGFETGLKNLKHRQERIDLWFEHFESLIMIYTSAIPAGNVSDVSLYDHSRATAALAAAIYKYHRETDFSIEAVKNYKDQKFLLINSNFYGIQNFLFGGFGSSIKKRSQTLRGRSFAVSLITELAADMICREIGLPFTSVILNAAGKFTVLAPNILSAEQAVKKTEDRINDWLYKMSFGETAMGFSFIQASCNDFVSGNFPALWDKKVQKDDEKKYSRIDLKKYVGVVSGYLNQFDNTLNSSICPICGKRPSESDVEGTSYVSDSSCKLCRDHVFLETNLVKKESIAVVSKNADIGGKENRLFEPVFDEYQVIFPDTFSKQEMENLIKNGQVMRYWNIGIDRKRLGSINVGVKLINGYVPVYDEADKKDDLLSQTEGEEVISGRPKTLSHIACMSLNPTEKQGKYSGIDALGILKADVDSLEMLIACGLKEKQFTLSRLSTLSRQLYYYFSVYLPDFFDSHKEFCDIYTVFAGGDDLFLIGPWNRIFDLSIELKKSFKDYVCKNPDIHFSAGISIHKSHTPLDFMAEMADGEMKKSKDKGRNRLTFFSETVLWDQTDKLYEIKNTLEQWLKDRKINNAMLYRINTLIEMASYEKQVVASKTINIKDMHATKWRAFLNYTVERNVSKNKKVEARKADIREIIGSLSPWLETYGNILKIPLWHILYNNRHFRNQL